MSIENQLREDMKTAMKEREAGKLRLSVLRMVLAAGKNKEIELGRQLTEEDWLAVLNREVKQRRESIAEFQRVNREDQTAKLEQEVAVLMGYLPQQLSHAEIEQLVRESIAAVDASGKKDMGKVMAVLMPKVKGRADGKLVNQIVSALLS